MTFKAKIFKLGHGHAVYIPAEVYTKYGLVEEVELEVITSKKKKEEVYTKVPRNSEDLSERKPYKWCNKHDVSTLTCLCK